MVLTPSMLFVSIVSSIGYAAGAVGTLIAIGLLATALHHRFDEMRSFWLWAGISAFITMAIIVGAPNLPSTTQPGALPVIGVLYGIVGLMVGLRAQADYKWQYAVRFPNDQEPPF